jgi:hypothetical protein
VIFPKAGMAKERLDWVSRPVEANGSDMQAMFEGLKKPKERQDQVR